MTDYEIYTFILCAIVFVVMVALSVYVVAVIYKLTVKLIKSGTEDQKIIAEWNKRKQKTKFSRVVDFSTLLILSLVVIFVFFSSLYINCTQNSYFDNVPTYRVVQTGSMAKKNAKNKYLFDNNLDNQIQTFDLIAMYKLPKEEDLKLYDIVIYEVDDMLIVHRIVEIEEPNQYHPNERHFRLQGDAIESPDRFPVLYSQMRGIYKGWRMPFIGSFIMFMQSPAGWLCVALVVGAIIVSPILDKKLLRHKEDRLRLIGALSVTVVEKAPEPKPQPAKTVVDKNKAQASMQGRLLNVYIGHNPQLDGSYVYTDASGVKIYSNYPMYTNNTQTANVQYYNQNAQNGESGVNGNEN